MTNWQLQTIQLFGEHHKAVLAELTGVDKRTVQRWMNGSLPIPQWVVENIDETYILWCGQCPICSDSDCEQNNHCRSGDGF